MFPYYVVLQAEVGVLSTVTMTIGIVKTAETDPPSYDDILRWQKEAEDAQKYHMNEIKVTFFARVAE